MEKKMNGVDPVAAAADTVAAVMLRCGWPGHLGIRMSDFQRYTKRWIVGYSKDSDTFPCGKRMYQSNNKERACLEISTYYRRQ